MANIARWVTYVRLGPSHSEVFPHGLTIPDVAFHRLSCSLCIYYSATGLQVEKTIRFSDFRLLEQGWNAGNFTIFGMALTLSTIVAMGRVTYVHHYVPALYFALLVLGFVLETCVPKRFYMNYIIYALLYAGCIYIYNLFSPIAQGMQGSAIDFRYLQWFNTWNIAL